MFSKYCTFLLSVLIILFICVTVLKNITIRDQSKYIEYLEKGNSINLFIQYLPSDSTSGFQNSGIDTLLFTYGKSKFMVTGKELKHGFLH